MYDQTRLLFSTLVILSQDVKMPVVGGVSDGKIWVTLLPVFVDMEAFFDCGYASVLLTVFS